MGQSSRPAQTAACLRHTDSGQERAEPLRGPQRITADIHSHMADTHIPHSFLGDIHQLPDVFRLFLIVDVCHNMIVVVLCGQRWRIG